MVMKRLIPFYIFLFCLIYYITHHIISAYHVFCVIWYVKYIFLISYVLFFFAGHFLCKAAWLLSCNWSTSSRGPVTCWHAWTCWTSFLLLNYRIIRPINNFSLIIVSELLRNISFIKSNSLFSQLSQTFLHRTRPLIVTGNKIFTGETLQVYISTKSSINSGEL